MNEKIKTFFLSILGIAVVVALSVGSFALFLGGVAAGAWAFPVLSAVVGVITVFVLPVLVLLSALKTTRRFAGQTLVFSSYFYGATLWIWSFFYTLHTWGWLAVIIGVFMAGVGIVPIAILAALFHGAWATIGQLLLGLLLTFGTRLYGIFMKAKAAEHANSLSSQHSSSSARSLSESFPD